jgi:hypothetical protein
VIVAIGSIVHPFNRGWNASGAFTIARRDVGLIAASHHLCLRLAGPRRLLLPAMCARTRLSEPGQAGTGRSFGCERICRRRSCELPVLAGAVLAGAVQADPVAGLFLAEGGNAFGGRGPGVAGPPGIGLPSTL